MIVSRFKNIRISGIAAAVSDDWTSVDSMKNEENAKTIEKFKNMTGVKGRYNAGIKQTTSDFCYVAAKELLHNKDIAIDRIGALVLVTQSPDYRIPATACVLHHRLGLSKDCIVFDVNLGCSGYTYGLGILGSIMESSNIEMVLLLAGDTSAKERNPKHATKLTNASKMLFGDSGTATLIQKCDNASPITCAYRTDGSGYKAIINPYEAWRNPQIGSGSEMDDIAVFNFTISEVPDLIKEYMNIQVTTPDDYDFLVPHQANLFVLKQMAKKAGFPMKKVLVSIDEFGNTSSASIPISLVKELGDRKDSNIIKPLMCGFGVGLSWSILSAEIETRDILPLIHTDEYFIDGY